MPINADAPPQILTPYTAFPCLLIDRVMPTLSDTEWRLLCVVVRQTLGWRDGANRRKTQDWLTHRQLQNRTGRASEALSRALNSLVTKGLVAVCDDQGNALNTAASRRRSAGRLFYRLGEAAIAPQDATSPKSEILISESGIRKAKTTKETQTKNSPDGEVRRYPLLVNSRNPTLENPNAAEGQSDVHRFLRAYRDAFRRHTPYSEPPVIDWGKDGRLVKQLLRLYSYDRLSRLLERFFASDDEWTRRHGYSLHAFKISIGRSLMQEGQNQRKLREAILNPVTIHTPGWQRAEEMLPKDLT